MIRRVKRVDPYWHKTAIGPGIILGSIALIAMRIDWAPAAVAFGIASAVGAFLATKPGLSGVFAVFGLIGGVAAFGAGPESGLSPLTRALAAAGFSVLYMVLIDVVVLTVAALYNAFTGIVGLDGLGIELSQDEPRRS